eukprot:gene5070-3656_t
MFSPCIRCLKSTPFDFGNAAKYISCSRIMEECANYVGGKWVECPASGDKIVVTDPCTDESVGEIPGFGAEIAERAISSASEAFQSWKDTLPRDRALAVRRWSDLMIKHRVTLGTILSRESGKVLSEGVGEVDYAQRFVEWYAGEAERIYGDIIPSPRKDVCTTVIKQPIGVVGIITPWNFPAAMITRAASAAIAAGCTVVVKPASATPFTALALAQLSEEAGIPPGVFNVITGKSSQISKALLDSFEVRKIAFTGSTEVGKSLYRGCADTVKKIGMELGGNAPFIVFEDADLERAADALMLAKFRNAGQTCICCNRVFVQQSVYEPFKRMVVERVTKMKVGNAFGADTTMGALIDKAAVETMKKIVKDAMASGAVVECGGSALDGKGCFFQPTVLSNVSHGSMCCQEEIFGPILPLVPFESETEAVKMANATRAGLASYLFSKDYSRQFRVASALRFGMVGVNDSALSAPCAPFGGVKESGLGRDGSKYGMEPFVDIKYILFSTV